MPMRSMHWKLQGSEHNIEELVKPLLGPEVTFQVNWSQHAKRYCWSDNNIQCPNDPEFTIWLGKPHSLYSMHAVCITHVRPFTNQYRSNGFLILQVVYKTDTEFKLTAAKNELIPISESELGTWLEEIESNT